MRLNPWGWVAAAYFIATTLGHLAFSLWLVSPRTLTWQGQVLHYSHRDALPYLLPLAALGLLAWLLWDARRHGTRRRTTIVAGYGLLWCACVAAVDRWLTYSLPEYFHYPQYAALAWLVAKALDPDRRHWPVGRVLLLTTALGAIDEITQYLWITTSYSHYLDFNDMLVNLLAAALGLVLYYGFRTPPTPLHTGRVPRAWAIASLVLGLALTGAVLDGRLRIDPEAPVAPGGWASAPDGRARLYLQREAGLYGRWHPSAWRMRHWVLSPAAGLGLVALTWLVWLPFAGRRYDPAARAPGTPQPLAPPS